MGDNLPALGFHHQAGPGHVLCLRQPKLLGSVVIGLQPEAR